MSSESVMYITPVVGDIAIPRHAPNVVVLIVVMSAPVVRSMIANSAPSNCSA